MAFGKAADDVLIAAEYGEMYSSIPLQELVTSQIQIHRGQPHMLKYTLLQTFSLFDFWEYLLSDESAPHCGVGLARGSSRDSGCLTRRSAVSTGQEEGKNIDQGLPIVTFYRAQ